MRFWPFAFTFLLSLTLWPSFGFAVDIYGPCETILKLDHLDKPFVITAQDRLAADKLIAAGNNELSDGVYQALFSLYVNARLRPYTKSQRKAILARFQGYAIHWRDSLTIQGNSNTKTSDIPKIFQGSVMPYFILVHELEHVIQLEIEGTIWGLIKYNLAGLPMYRMENHAMQAEWEFLSLVPMASFDQVIGVLNMSKLDAKERALYFHTFKSAKEERTNRAGYVLKQHKLGRYSGGETLRLTTAQHAKLLLGGIVVLGCFKYLSPFL